MRRQNLHPTSLTFEGFRTFGEEASQDIEAADFDCNLQDRFHFAETRKAITKGVVRLAPLRAGIENREGEAENEGEYPIERIPRDD